MLRTVWSTIPRTWGVDRTDDVVFIQITLNAGRTTELKKALYARIAHRLAESPGVRPQDVLINLVEVARENWSFGNGVAQYVSWADLSAVRKLDLDCSPSR